MDEDKKIPPKISAKEQENTATNEEENISQVKSNPGLKSIYAEINQFDFELPAGYLYESQVYKKVRLKSLTISDRDLFTEKKYRNNPQRLKTELVKRKLVSLEGFEGLPKDIEEKLLVMDRNAIIYAVVMESVDNVGLNIDFTCVNKDCNEKNSVKLTYEWFEENKKEMPQEERSNIVNGNCCSEVHLPEYGFKCSVRHQNALLEEKFFNKEAQGELTSLYALSEIVADFNGEGKKPESFYRDLSIEFIQELENAIRKKEYGYDFYPLCKCFNCKEETRVNADPLVFILREKFTQKKS